MNENDSALCSTIVRLLQAASVLAAWSLGLSMVAMAVLALTGRSLPLLSWLGFGGVALAGALERYLAFRLRFDAGLFKDLATQQIASLDTLDSSLQCLNLRPAPGQPRGLMDRVMGARQLIQRHTIVVICQSALFWLALLTQDPR
jgi:hypothetical protein